MTLDAAAPVALTGPLPDIRLVTVDMDGTLLDGDHRIPDSLWSLLPQLRDRGILVCPASGRQHATLAAQFARVADDLVIIAGGRVRAAGERFKKTAYGRAILKAIDGQQ